MRKLTVYFLAILGILFTFSTVGMAFSDVPTTDPNYQAITKLNEKGIINGYEDGSFRPKASITRAEAAAIFARSGLIDRGLSEISYKDVLIEHWSYPYIMKATKAGIMNGVGKDLFAPNQKLTYYQIIKMAASMMDIGQTRAYRWPYGYLYRAEKEEIIDTAFTQKMQNSKVGNRPATRGDVSRILYQTLLKREEKEKRYRATLGGVDYQIGMDTAQLPSPDEIVSSYLGIDWYVYGTDNYRGFYTLGVQNGKVVALASSGLGFTYLDYQAGDQKQDKSLPLFIDSNDGNKIHGVLIFDEHVRLSDDFEQITAQQYMAESRINYHFTNGFRVWHGKKPVEWNDLAAESARLHSEDMARNNYFDHVGLDGSQPWDRMRRQGVSYITAGENIAGGYRNGFRAYDGWVNSAGHRENMLGDWQYLGVGTAYQKDSKYEFLQTQNFFSKGLNDTSNDSGYRIYVRIVD